MYLWQRGNSYVFQIRVPQPYVRRIGSTHLRRNLGRVSKLEARHRAIILADGLLRILAMADAADIPPTDEKIVVACNWWLNKRSWRETLQNTVGELLPADLFAQRDSITRRIFEVWTEPDIDEETGQYWSREYNSVDEVKEDFGHAAGGAAPPKSSRPIASSRSNSDVRHRIWWPWLRFDVWADGRQSTGNAACSPRSRIWSSMICVHAIPH